MCSNVRAGVRWRALALPAALYSLIATQVAGQSSPPTPAAPSAAVDAVAVASPYAWDISLALESASNVRGAWDVMVNTYGVRPGVYGACVRVAWLSLRLGEHENAIVLYRRAIALDESQPEARSGLALALTRRGYVALDRGEYAIARRAWEEALALEPNLQDAKRGLALVERSDAIAPEMWFGRVSATQNASGTSVFFATVPVRLSSWLQLRGSFRNVGSPTSATGTVPLFGTQREFFGGVLVERGRVGTDVIGLRLVNDVNTTNGGAVRVRAGGRIGASLLASAVQTSSGSNMQLSPVGFRWLRPSLRVSAGARLTSDSALTGVSALLGATWVHREAEVDVTMHAGTERWAFDMAGPTILSFLAQSSGGGKMTASVAFSSGATLSAQLQAEHILSPSLGSGWYRSMALGVRFVPKGGIRR